MKLSATTNIGIPVSYDLLYAEISPGGAAKAGVRNIETLYSLGIPLGNDFGVGVEKEYGYFHPYGGNHSVGDLSNPDYAYGCPSTEIYDNNTTNPIQLGVSAELYTPFGGMSVEIGWNIDFFSERILNIWTTW